nr:MAG TPA: hypothetical protein [Caudoviricetes sp.]
MGIISYRPSLFHIFSSKQASLLHWIVEADIFIFFRPNRYIASI